jgi:hypothetical protein
MLCECPKCTSIQFANEEMKKFFSIKQKKNFCLPSKEQIFAKIPNIIYTESGTYTDDMEKSYEHSFVLKLFWKKITFRNKLECWSP